MMIWSNTIILVISIARCHLGCSFVSVVTPLSSHHHEHHRQYSLSMLDSNMVQQATRRLAPRRSSMLSSKPFDSAHYGTQKKKINRTILFSNRPSPSAYAILPSTPDDKDNNLQTFQNCLTKMSLPTKTKSQILSDIRNMGFTTSSELYNFAIDFEERPEILAEVLRDDFGMAEFGALRCHQIRAALMRLVRVWELEEELLVSSSGSLLRGDGEMRNDNGGVSQKKEEGGGVVENAGEDTMLSVMPLNNNGKGSKSSNSREGEKKKSVADNDTALDDTKKTLPVYKSVVVNQKAKKRFSASPSSSSSSSSSSHNSASNSNYGLPTNYQSSYPKLAIELDEFLHFMTHPSVEGQENPIREATAIVYLRHARLFIGWFWNYYRHDKNNKINNDHPTTTLSQKTLSLTNIIPNKNAQSTQPILAFILWLRHNRQISDSYEANMLRGLSKLVKFRFAKESSADPTYGEKSYQDIPAVRELRKLHRDAGKRTLLGTRSSDEEKKWLDWDEYLGVVRAMRDDVEEELGRFVPVDHPPVQSGDDGSDGEERNTSYTTTQRRIAIKLQNYLILAFFSAIPDRQRTFRELTLHNTFLRNDSLNAWTIKHGPDDYKTGKVYGDRPPLVIPPELTPTVDDFLKRWRPCLHPTGPHVFVQSRTGNGLTSDSLYSIVSRSCYKHSGKKTNPHLLRDMIVTHVRNSNASEKELEALALYMGHSLSMQRTSYDRRTAEQKVAPAVNLLRSVNELANNGEDGTAGS